MYHTIESIVCDESIPAKLRVAALNGYEEAYNSQLHISSYALSFGRILPKQAIKAREVGLEIANCIVSRYLR